MSAHVSVLMPLYKPQPDHLRAAIDCVFKQTYKDWKIVLFNQPWEFDLKAELQDYLDDPRVTFIQGDRYRTIGENWNACLPYADTPYIQYLFHDDLWEPDYLEKMIAPLEQHPNVGFVSANHTYFFEGEVRTVPLYEEVAAFVQEHITPGVHEHMEFLHWWMGYGLRPNVIGEPSFVMLRKELVDKVGPFDPVMRQFLDSEYWTRCLVHADWYYVPEDIGKFRVHPAAASAQNEMAGKGIFERFSTFQRLIKLLPASEKPKAKKALAHTFEQMIARYMERRKEGRAVSGEGSGELKKFCLMHPFFVGKAFLKFFLSKKTQKETTVADT